MKNIFRDFFTFNKRERNGVFILLSIIGGLILYLNVSSRFVSREVVDFTAFDKDVKKFQETIEEQKKAATYHRTSSFEASSETAVETNSERFYFNPNNLPEQEWKRLGLSEKQIKSIKKYESKGGKFRTKADVKKMYCIKQEQYESLEPYIQIGSLAESARAGEKTTSVFQDGKVENTSLISKSDGEHISLVDLNTADSAMLTGIKGIGPFYAKNIIKYRNAIGGFVKKEQLLEIWKFDQEKLNAIEKHIVVDATKIKKINLNSCEPSDLKSPYISWTIANAIVNYRKNHGKYKTVDEIKKTDLVDEETYRKIVPYLVLGD
ncbi:MAG: helix-hairpin-helix domain-containing protein [Bacteroidetes bacterium]|nr:helix-hairpin-helix domain-containing protein [Bacteroidota bacterium]